jgi:predicted peptidase
MQKISEDKNDDRFILDTISSEELNKARDSFKQYSFTDSKDSSKVLHYNLFIPENYSKNEKYPLMMFIGDGSTVGREKSPITRTVGGPIWATDTVQKKHKCFVLIPEYNELIIDDIKRFYISEYINVTIRLISQLQKDYNIDSNRIYSTGQSMGAMTTLYILANNPNLLAAGLIADGQWKIDELTGLVDATFTYFAAAGDHKAFTGQNEVKKYFDSKNIKYGSLDDINAKEKVDILNNETKKMYDLGYKQNFISFAKGTVISPNSVRKNEHMESFKYAYRIETVRDWIFSQVKK